MINNKLLFMGNLSEALLLLLVGIILVMVVLWLVGILGTIIIKITNRFASKEELNNRGGGRNIEPKKLAAIVAAVDVVTGGKGTISSIHKNR